MKMKKSLYIFFHSCFFVFQNRLELNHNGIYFPRERQNSYFFFNSCNVPLKAYLTEFGTILDKKLFYNLILVTSSCFSIILVILVLFILQSIHLSICGDNVM